MKIGIISDTHGDAASIRKVLAVTPPVERWIHCGDFADDANLLEQATGLPVCRVCGNCDALHGPVTAKPDAFLEWEGCKVWVTHGNLYVGDARDINQLFWWARKLEQDIVIFGHIHRPVFEEQDGVWIVNPGSPSRPRDGSRAGFAVLTLSKGRKPRVDFYTV
ncbi:MAG: metallophosphoesterase [Acidaminococcaceae bacterium]|nr:metallophosphoesterase [Acidaminococcaceae bacterium]